MAKFRGLLIERLEDRSLLSVTLPFQYSYSSAVGLIYVANGESVVISSPDSVPDGAALLVGNGSCFAGANNAAAGSQTYSGGSLGLDNSGNIVDDTATVTAYPTTVYFDSNNNPVVASTGASVAQSVPGIDGNAGGGTQSVVADIQGTQYISTTPPVVTTANGQNYVTVDDGTPLEDVDADPGNLPAAAGPAVTTLGNAVGATAQVTFEVNTGTFFGNLFAWCSGYGSPASMTGGAYGPPNPLGAGQYGNEVVQWMNPLPVGTPAGTHICSTVEGPASFLTLDNPNQACSDGGCQNAWLVGTAGTTWSITLYGQVISSVGDPGWTGELPPSGGFLANWQVLGTSVKKFTTATCQSSTPISTITPINNGDTLSGVTPAPTPPASMPGEIVYQVDCGGPNTSFQSTITVTIPQSGKIEIASIHVSGASQGATVITCMNSIVVTSLTQVGGGGGNNADGDPNGGAAFDPTFPISPTTRPATVFWQRLAAFSAVLTAVEDTIDADNIGAHSTETLFAAGGMWIDTIDIVMAENGGIRAGATPDMYVSALAQVLASNGMTVSPASGAPNYVQTEAAAAAADTPSGTTDDMLLLDLAVLNFFANNQITLNV